MQGQRLRGEAEPIDGRAMCLFQAGLQGETADHHGLRRRPVGPSAQSKWHLSGDCFTKRSLRCSHPRAGQIMAISAKANLGPGAPAA